MNQKTRAWWWSRQGLDGSLAGVEPAEVLRRSGWARSVGGSNPYTTLYARAGVTRQRADDAVAALDIHELPSARGCTYVVPATDFALALKVGAGAPEAELRVLDKLGVPRTELESLAELIMAELDEPRTPRELRERLGTAVRSLGEEGKKRGHSSTLPATLGLLQARGHIRRVPLNGGLDEQRYAYIRWAQPPEYPGDERQALTELAARFFEWTGAASLASLRWFTGCGAKTAKELAASLELVEIEEGLLALPELAEEYANYAVPEEPYYALLHALDGLFLLRRDIQTVLEEAEQNRPVPHEHGRLLGQLRDFADHVIVDRGTVIGFWQFDPEDGTIAAWTRSPMNERLRAVLTDTERFIGEQLGDHSWNVFDKPASRRERIEALRGEGYC